MNVKVLVVDDTDHVRTMLVEMLALDGFEVVGQAASGGDAIDLAPVTSPDVIVMDYKMPDMNGLEAAERVRAARPDQPIILYTAYLDPGLEQRAREVGVALCVGKVEGINQLERHIRELARSLGEHHQQAFDL